MEFGRKYFSVDEIRYGVHFATQVPNLEEHVQHQQHRDHAQDKCRGNKRTHFKETVRQLTCFFLFLITDRYNSFCSQETKFSPRRKA